MAARAAYHAGMRYLISLVMLLAWGIWLGGTLALFLFVRTLFTQDRSVAIEAAPRMFAIFERVQLGFAAAGVLASIGVVALARRKSAGTVLVMVLLASMAAAAQSTLVSPKMHALRVAGNSDSPEFRRLHGSSMMLYSSQAVALLVAGCFLPGALRLRVVSEPA